MIFFFYNYLLSPFLHKYYRYIDTKIFLTILKHIPTVLVIDFFKNFITTLIYLHTSGIQTYDHRHLNFIIAISYNISIMY